jgi:hypothetical protein
MCQIILGSQRFERLPQLLPRDPQDTPFAYVPTAADLLDDPEWVEKEPDTLHDMGFPVTVLPLTGTSPGEVAAVLASTVAVYLAGGNPWYLLHQANLSGFTALVPNLVASGRLTYVGMSAGAHLATPDLLPAVRETTRNVVPGLVRDGYCPVFGGSALRPGTPRGTSLADPFPPASPPAGADHRRTVHRRLRNFLDNCLRGDMTAAGKRLLMDA